MRLTASVRLNGRFLVEMLLDLHQRCSRGLSLSSRFGTGPGRLVDVGRRRLAAAGQGEGGGADQSEGHGAGSGDHGGLLRILAEGAADLFDHWSLLIGFLPNSAGSIYILYKKTVNLQFSQMSWY